jgi:osmotically inducible protein OsmC
MKVLYTAEATASGDGRDGRVTSSDGLLDAAVATPVELGGKGGATNPEQLFAAGYAACFLSALRLAGRAGNMELSDAEVTAKVGFGRSGKGFGLTVTLDIALPGVADPVAERLVATAHQYCPYSNATRGNIDVTLNIVETVR